MTVILGLRPYTAKANILPEQTVGRGLRLMFGGGSSGYIERVDVIGNKTFIEFVEQLEREEDIQLETFEIGKDKVGCSSPGSCALVISRRSMFQRSTMRPSGISPEPAKTPSRTLKAPSSVKSLPAAPGYPLYRAGQLGSGPPSLACRGRLPTPAQQIVFQEYVRAVNEHHERLDRIEAELLEQAKAWRFYPVVEALQAPARGAVHRGYQHRGRARGSDPL